MEYQEPIKIKAREKVLSHAIECLTSEKNNYGYLIDENYPERVIEQIRSRNHSVDNSFINALKKESIESWKNFYRNNRKIKKVSELKVAYLSGPNPENDLRVLTGLGVLPENVWAFESENKVYNKAVFNILSSENPFIKIVKGKIKNFFRYSPIKFDIVYLDFCGNITSSESISTLMSLFYNQCITSTGVLITNFAYADEHKNPLQWNNTMKLCANYLFPKSFVESHENYGGISIEDSLQSLDEYLGLIQSNPMNSYSQFITRLMIDMASFIAPYQRLAKNTSLQNLFFKDFKCMEIPNDWFEDLETVGRASLIMSFKNQLPLKDDIDWEKVSEYGNLDEKYLDNDFKKFFKRFVSRLSIDTNESQLIEILGKIEYLNKGHKKAMFFSEKLNNINKNWHPFKNHVFCDVFLFHQVIDILMRQICVPYHYNLKLIKRWVYKAKETEMFMDVIPFDECRYLYDWMPTIDMFEAGIEDIDRQLIFRFVMDGISKHGHWYSEEFLSGTAVTSMNEPGFNVFELEERIRIS